MNQLYPQYSDDGNVHNDDEAALYDSVFDFLDDEMGQPAEGLFFGGCAQRSQEAKAGQINVVDVMPGGLAGALANAPESLTNPLYTQGFFRTQIGRDMRAEFQIGDQITSVEGKLACVGASYLLLQQAPDGKLVFCDIGGIRFASIDPSME